jgi:hypothetical protein
MADHASRIRHEYRDGTCRACDREKPVTQLCQTRTTMRELPLSNNGALSIEKASLVFFRPPINTGAPCMASSSILFYSLSYDTRAVTTSTITCTGGRGRDFLLAGRDTQAGRRGQKTRRALRRRQTDPASRAAVKKQTTGLTEDGLPVHSFRSLLAALATLARNTITTAITPNHPLTVATRPTSIQQKAFDLLGTKCTQ